MTTEIELAAKLIEAAERGHDPAEYLEMRSGSAQSLGANDDSSWVQNSNPEMGQATLTQTAPTDGDDFEVVRRALTCSHSTDSPDYCDCPSVSEALAALDRIKTRTLPESITSMRLIIDREHILYFCNDNPGDCDGPVTLAAVEAAIAKIKPSEDIK